MTGVRRVTGSANETRALGTQLGALLLEGDVLLLHGDLGAGKTTLAQGIIATGRPGIPVQSPTFTLVNEYPATGDRPALHHLDLYRLDGPDDLDSIGFDDLVASGAAVVLVEWPERLGPDLPDEYLLVSIEPDGPDGRRIDIRSVPADGRHARLVDAIRT